MSGSSMSVRKTLARSALLLAVAGAAACSGRAAHAQFNGPALSPSQQTNQVMTPTTDPAVLNPGSRDVMLEPGDQIQVRLFGIPDFAPPLRIGVDGTIQLPLIGVVPISGLTVNNAEDLIARRLIDAGMYKNPQVTIQVTEAVTQFATVSGELHGIVPVGRQSPPAGCAGADRVAAADREPYPDGAAAGAGEADRDRSGDGSDAGRG